MKSFNRIKTYKDFLKEYDDRTDRYVADEIKRRKLRALKDGTKWYMTCRKYIQYAARRPSACRAQAVELVHFTDIDGILVNDELVRKELSQRQSP